VYIAGNAPRMIAQHPAAVRGPETGRRLRATK